MRTAMPKRPFKRVQKKKRHGTSFWDREYANPEHLALSSNHSEDLEKFTRWLERRKRDDILQQGSSVLDVGCGNGRNLIYLGRTFGVSGFGFDTSAAAIAQAKAAAANLPLTFSVRSMAGALDQADESQALALDMMSSHYLSHDERLALRDELARVLQPGGYLFMKTFLKDEDLHTERLLREHPGPEPGTYIHPVIGVPEYVYGEEELLTFLGERFIVREVYRSHRHRARGRARKRRTITVYAERDFR